MNRLILLVFKTIVISCFVFYCNITYAQYGPWLMPLWSNTITGVNPNVDNPYTTGQSYDSFCVGVSGIGRGPGITGVNATDRYNAAGWDSPILDTNDYFYFTMYPNGPIGSFCANWFGAWSIMYTSQVSSNGPSSFAIRTSFDYFTTNLNQTNLGPNGDSEYFSNYASNWYDSISIRIYAWGATSASGTFSIDDFQLRGILPLSIKIEKFNVVKINNSASLSWQLSGNDDGEKIVILHSLNGQTFTTLGTVGQNVSSWIDDNPTAGMNYYKLKIINLDGTFNFSNTLSLDFSSPFSITYYPNPAQNVLHANYVSKVDKVKTISIYSFNGMLVYHANEFENDIDISSFPNGNYLIRTVLDDGNAQTQTFLVSK